MRVHAGLLRPIPSHNIVNISYLQMSSLAATIIAWWESMPWSKGPLQEDPATIAIIKMIICSQRRHSRLFQSIGSHNFHTKYCRDP